MEQRFFFSTNDTRTTGPPHAKKEKKKVKEKKKKKDASRHRPYILNSKCIIYIMDLNVKCQTIQFIEDNTVENLHDAVHGNDSLLQWQSHNS